VTTSHLAGGKPGAVAKAGTAARDVPEIQGRHRDIISFRRIRRHICARYIDRTGHGNRPLVRGDVVSAKVAIVAGAGGPLGRATTAALTASGLTVVAVDRNEQGLRELPGSVRREGADATDPAVAARIIDRIAP
jgi:hypothetical protein